MHIPKKKKVLFILWALLESFCGIFKLLLLLEKSDWCNVSRGVLVFHAAFKPQYRVELTVDVSTIANYITRIRCLQNTPRF